MGENKMDADTCMNRKWGRGSAGAREEILIFHDRKSTDVKSHAILEKSIIYKYKSKFQKKQLK